ncbi:hypothetical protein [Streptomyces sp. NPDC023588]|uniref:hypothetical protein n=1 Tax=Streptomyces sp. NPDC023588 TaxID=3154907 RepID=UPI00340F9C02
MKTIADLYVQGGAAALFVKRFRALHNGVWHPTKDHWSFTWEHIAGRASELEGLTESEAEERVAELTQTLCWDLLQAGKCWACEELIK